MKRTLMLIFLFTTALLLTGCNLTQRFAQPSPSATYPAPITSEPSLPTLTPLPAITPTPLPSPTPYQPIQGKILFDNLRLRMGPGFLFEAYGLYPIDHTIQLLGRAPGDNWLYVQMEDGKVGWVKVESIDLEGNLYDAPEVTPDNVVIVHGRIFAPNGSPASFITVMVNPVGAGTDTSKQDVGVSDFTGRFYIYLPAGTSGDWTLVTNGYGCRSSVADNMCSMYALFPPEQVITLPEAANNSLEIELLAKPTAVVN